MNIFISPQGQPCHFKTKFKCKMVVSPFCMDTGTKSWTPLVDRVIDDALLRPTRQSNAASDRQRLAPSPDKHGPASYPTPCTQGWRRGCWEVTDLEQWNLEPLVVVTRPERALWAGGCTVLLKSRTTSEDSTTLDDVVRDRAV